MSEINGIKITVDNGAFFVSARRAGRDNYKPDFMHHDGAAALRRAAELLGLGADPVVGDQLPPVGSKVLIHLGRQDAWVEHTVTGYYAWGDHGGNDSLHRVFVRVVDSNGYPNARLLKDIRPVEAVNNGGGQRRDD